MHEHKARALIPRGTTRVWRMRAASPGGLESRETRGSSGEAQHGMYCGHETGCRDCPHWTGTRRALTFGTTVRIWIPPLGKNGRLMRLYRFILPRRRRRRSHPRHGPSDPLRQTTPKRLELREPHVQPTFKSRRVREAQQHLERLAPFQDAHRLMTLQLWTRRAPSS